MVGALESIAGLSLPQRIAAGWVLFALVGAIVIAMAAALYPVYRLNRFDAVCAVRTG